MTFLQSLLLGLVQGLTEFLPISSSAHLVLVPFLLGWDIPEDQIFPFGVLVQLGTLAAVILYFWRDLWAILSAWTRGLLQRQPFATPQARLGWYLILATIPAVVVGILLKDQVESVFNSPIFTAIFLFVTAGLLLAAERFGRRSRSLETLNWKDSLWIGIFQAISIFPGVSRSGATMAGGMTRHLDRRAAGRFSFLMSIPIMLGASLVSIPSLLEVPNLGEFLPVLIAGTLTAGVVGFLSIHWLLSFISKHSFKVFAIYCAVLGGLVLLLSAVLPSTTPEPVATPTAPVVSTLRVETTAALRWLQPTFNQCAEQQPGLGILLAELPATGINPGNGGLALRWGPPQDSSTSAYVLGEDELVVVVNPANPLGSLTRDQFQQVFSGSARQWAEVVSSSECLNCPSGAINLWIYPSGMDTQDALSNLVPGGTHSGYAFLAPDPQRMREAIANDPTAIGFLPRHWVDGSVRALDLPEIPLENRTFPILALSVGEPTGATRAWLGCLQQTAFSGH